MEEYFFFTRVQVIVSFVRVIKKVFKFKDRSVFKKNYYRRTVFWTITDMNVWMTFFVEKMFHRKHCLSCSDMIDITHFFFVYRLYKTSVSSAIHGDTYNTAEVSVREVEIRRWDRTDLETDWTLFLRHG